MAQDPDRNEWIAVKDQFEELKQRESQSVPDVQETFDEEIRRRFGEMISRAAVGTPKSR